MASNICRTAVTFSSPSGKVSRSQLRATAHTLRALCEHAAMSNELWKNSALELAAMIAGKEVSSREVVDAHLARMDEVNPAVNAVVRRFDEQARAEADAADRMLAAGEPLGP